MIIKNVLNNLLTITDLKICKLLPDEHAINKYANISRVGKVAIICSKY